MLPEERQARIDELFHQVVRLDSGERAKSLEEATGDAEIRTQVERLLEAHDHQPGVSAVEPAPERPLEELMSEPASQSTNGNSQSTIYPHHSSHATAVLEHPTHIGRYEVERLIGEGGFGRVYLAHDTELGRRVAIKVPKAELLSIPEHAEAYREEARTVAQLEHAHIVPVYDSGSTDQFPVYVVSKYIEGCDLATKLKDGRLGYRLAAEIISTVAESLQYAHEQGLVHRDIKPGNILLDSSGNPFVVDFGLALREQDLGKGPSFAGTPAYMSPEQVSGEGHRVDGRSDIFSLSIVFYELLTGRRPFHGDNRLQMMAQISAFEPRPPRQYDPTIPAELERICLKGLSKRATDRYTTASDFAADLRHCLRESSADTDVASEVVTPREPTSIPSGVSQTIVDSTSIKIIPKGLRSFDEHDADFFLELLPGPRDREGLPDNIRFWRIQVEEADPDKTFAVGLIYGPSGCGKSSLVKAGLLPRLSPNVISVYLECTPEDTESRLLKGVQKHCPRLDHNLDLKDTLMAVRRGVGLASGKKVLIVLDQFEQWLHARKEEVNSELVQALRQCDGCRVQCLVMIRDDFWMAATRFMRELEIQLVEGQNSAAVDLFDLDHSRRILTAFGRAFGKILESDVADEQREFVRQAVAGLADGGKIICVRLALFAEMTKGASWTPAALKEIGGTSGVGITFLEETFSASTAPPEHRYHQKAARAVLKALLPESGTDIKGNLHSYDELLQVSGYARRAEDFKSLMRILDGEVRLITPSDLKGLEAEDDHPTPVEAGQHYYQLTHDYLVAPLRDWLTRKQKETRRGRAELLLDERSALWNAEHENRHLPTLWEYLSIRTLTDGKGWDAPRRSMLRQASRYYAIRGAAFGLLCLVVAAAGTAAYGHFRGTALVERVATATTSEVAGIIDQLPPYRYWANPRLQQLVRDSPPRSDRKRNASLALLPVDREQVAYLAGRLLQASPAEFPMIRDSLGEHRDSLLDDLWSSVERTPLDDPDTRLRAACALASYDPNNARWDGVKTDVAEALVSINPAFLGPWKDALRPVRKTLLDPLRAIFRNERDDELKRSLATAVLADYVADDVGVLAELVADADRKQFGVVFSALEDHGAFAVAELESLLEGVSQPAEEAVKERLAKRKANAAVALLKLAHDDNVWPILEHGPDPRTRSYLVHRVAALKLDPSMVIHRLKGDKKNSLFRALLLCLGELTERLAEQDRRSLLPQLWSIYETEPDAGIHSAAEWVLRKWGQADGLNARARELQTRPGTVGRDWFVNQQGQTFAVVPGPVEFVMGSPPSEAGRDEAEHQHTRRIRRSFAIMTHEVTVAEFQRFRPDSVYVENISPEPDCPLNAIRWYDAAAYCNWLSRQDGLPEKQWCYLPNSAGKFDQGMRPAANYLERTGYRLPTEAEWEYACRAGASTCRYFGESDSLLGQYGLFAGNSSGRTLPVGTLKPNDFGLFDMHGNLFEWCHESYAAYAAGTGRTSREDREDVAEVRNSDFRILRGGSFNDSARDTRSARRSRTPPSLRNRFIGMRAVRTLRLSVASGNGRQRR